ncbi:hypothetical protein F8M41_017447 [Gigaspora margarita]|uniref:Uncharacterized protein n=1 Tax=Gigaspora margarita TaxID=4874 RepID=A0A8H4B312_GIGMA|nr:hypothetical protein F8M41_017447 [Gigaspora margarita]
MESNNQCNQTSDQYNPLDDTINTVLPGLLPALIVGLFKGFEKAKRKGFSSPINVFDDFIIFYSITIYPLVSGIQCYNHVSQFCEDTFHLDNCRFMRTKISSAYGICGMLNLFASIYHFYIVKQFSAIHNRFKEIRKRYSIIHYFLIAANYIIISTLMIYPAFIVGYILSNNTYTTKISFSICSIAFSRLIEHFGEDPEKINTVISYYLNYREDLEIDATKVQKNEILDDLIENLKDIL